MNKKNEKVEKNTEVKKNELKKVSSFKKKKKIKKNITSGIAYVYSTFNNTIISIADENGNVVSIDRSDKRPIVHWITEGIETKLAIADGKELVYVEGLLEKHNHPIGTIVQLERIGYAIVEKDGLLMVHD